MRSLIFGLVLLLVGCQQADTFVSSPYTYLADSEGNLQRVTYSVVDGQAVFEGDILLGDVDSVEETRRLVESGARGAIVNRMPFTFWSHKTVPYVISPELPNPERVHEAIRHYHQNTSLSFVPRTNQFHYIEFTPSTICASRLGRGVGRQKIFLAPGCGTKAAIHEIGHALGLWHEQSRWDRDEHITVHWENIASGQAGQFSRNLLLSKDVGAYDFNSVMHYNSHAFSKNGKATITRKDGSTDVGRGDGLSPLDRPAIRHLYP